MDNSNNPNYPNPLPSNTGPDPNPNLPQAPSNPIQSYPSPSPTAAPDNPESTWPSTPLPNFNQQSQTTNPLSGTYQPPTTPPTLSPAPPSFSPPANAAPTWPSTPLPTTSASPLTTIPQPSVEPQPQTFPSNFASSPDYSTPTLPIEPPPANITSTQPQSASIPLQTTPLSISEEPTQTYPIQNEPLATAYAPPSPTPILSPLDNPWGAPTQPPTIDGSATTPAAPQQPAIQPSWMNVGASTSATLPSTPDSTPTDLSHLITNNSLPETPIAPETLVVPPQTPTQEAPALPAEGHKGIPKWVIGLGIGLLIIVAGATAYFILGIGQPPKTTTSLPAETAKATLPQVKPPAPITTPSQPTPPPDNSGSTNFGQLEGVGQSATSAADLIKQRQQTR
ncbi:hypothetical protein HY384_01970 [Candidatus Daviesbacteria bacterium]|nr:hypothetical protein [Candidatus Daviesbacteria bacterium]